MTSWEIYMIMDFFDIIKLNNNNNKINFKKCIYSNIMLVS
jgi:hypothetical protein